MKQQEDWPRLAAYVVSARKAAGYATAIALAGATGVTSRTLGKLERGERVSRDTLAAVAREVGWAPDSPDRVLAGGEPVPASRRGSSVPLLVPQEPGGFPASISARLPGRMGDDDRMLLAAVWRMMDGDGRLLPERAREDIAHAWLDHRYGPARRTQAC